MRQTIKISLAALTAASLVMSVAQAKPGPLPFQSTAGSSLTSEPAQRPQRASSALEIVLSSFLAVTTRVEASAATAAAKKETPAEECESEEETQIADAEKPEGEEDQLAHQGPEPIYFAF